MLATVELLHDRISTGRADVCIIGLGYVGLPLAVAVAESGFPTVGLDVDQERVASLNAGVSYIPDVATEQIAALRSSGRLRATTHEATLSSADVIVICVPTPLTKAKEPDLTCIKHVVGQVAEWLRPGQIIILESTTYPGTTQEVVQPMLVRTGLGIGSDVFLAFAPERLDPGNTSYDFRRVPKVVGGVTLQCTRLAIAFYSQFIDHVVPVSSPRVAEMVKIYENVFRNVNIALVNELTLLCDRMGLDIWEVIDAASTKPYGFMRFDPGPGVGGHCIPVDPYYLAAKAREYDFHMRLVGVAAQINDAMPYYVVAKTTRALSQQGKALSGARVLVLGATYKRDVADVRESPVLKILNILGRSGAQVAYHDPYVDTVMLPNPGEALRSVRLDNATVESADCVIIATDHSVYDYGALAARAKLVVDTRNATAGLAGAHIVRI